VNREDWTDAELLAILRLKREAHRARDHELVGRIGLVLLSWMRNQEPYPPDVRALRERLAVEAGPSATETSATVRGGGPGGGGGLVASPGRTGGSDAVAVSLRVGALSAFEASVRSALASREALERGDLHASMTNLGSAFESLGAGRALSYRLSAIDREQVYAFRFEGLSFHDLIGLLDRLGKAFVSAIV
jgi:hypothetical protein